MPYPVDHRWSLYVLNHPDERPSSKKQQQAIPSVPEVPTPEKRDRSVSNTPRKSSGGSNHTAARGRSGSFGKRLDLAAVAEGPDTTTLFMTYTLELRGDRDVYMMGLDRCYTSLCEANARVDLLGHCNTNIRSSAENKFMECDIDTGCLTVTWGEEDSAVRFMATAKKIEMGGEVTKAMPGENESWNKDHGFALFFPETELEAPGHVWVVAIHSPLHSAGNTDMRSPSAASHKILGRIAEADRSRPSFSDQESDSRLATWTIDSIHSNGDKALATAKKAWNEHFKSYGRCQKLREHYGSARYSFKPAKLSAKDAQQHFSVQIRVERVRVMPKGELLAHFSEPGRQVSAHGKVFKPPIRNVGGEIISTEAGARTSFLVDILEIANQAFGIETSAPAPAYENLSILRKVQQEHEALTHNLTDRQRHGGGEKKAFAASADLYHALSRKEDTYKRKVSRSRSYLEAQMRMTAALEARFDDDEVQESDS